MALFSDPDTDGIVWETNPDEDIFDGLVQAEMVAGPEERLGEMALFSRVTIEAESLD